MAKQGGTLTANTDLKVLDQNLSRTAITVINADPDVVLHVEFGSPASNNATAGSWLVKALSALTIGVDEWEDIRESVYLRSTGTPQFVVRTAE